ncbi:MAG: hypothetical protein CXR31_12170 [Geobacter sp.]|nr:MAG: hypothetical protein CXR31_12170 [Geobacter sp.]
MVVVLFGGLPRAVQADIISGSAELDMNLSWNKTKDATGVVTSNSKGNEFMQKYNISLAVNPFPLLKISSGALIQQDVTTLHDINSNSHGTTTSFSPYFDALLTNTLYQAGVGYVRTENSQSGTLAVEPKTINEEYHAALGWRPVDLPDLSVRLSHANNYDVDRLNRDGTTDMVSVGSRYMYRTFKLGYQFTGTDTRDNLHDTDTTQMLHNASVSYSDQFFDKRVSLYSQYNVNYQQSTTSAGNGGVVDTALFPVSGISAFNIDPSLGTADQNTGNPALIDSNFTSTTGINLGVVAPAVNTNNKWSIGVDFFNVTEINKIRIFVDRQLPTSIASAFTWQIWVRDRETDTWSQIDQNGTTVAPNSANMIPATFEPLQNNYDFTLTLLSSVKTRFIKVVVNTLPQSMALANPSFQNPDRIFVTEFQGVLSQPAAQVKGTRSSSSQNLNMDVRTRILDSPSLYHSLNLSLTATSGADISYILNNSLLLDHKINEVFSVGATVGREDISSSGQQSSAFLYSASLKAIPLVGLTNTLVYSGRIDYQPKGTTDNNSIFFTNISQPYKGVAFNLSAGYGISTNLVGQKSENLSFASGTSITPRQDLSFTLTYNLSKSNITGGTTPPSSSSSQNGLLGISYRPFPSLYLFASLGVQQGENQQTQYIQNYGGNWSPFPDGDLQFNVAYNENATTLNNQKDTNLTPSVSWRIAPRATLNLSYSLLTSESLISSTKSSYVSMILRLFF